MKPDYLETVTERDPAHGSVSSGLLFVGFDLSMTVAKVEHKDESSLYSD